MVKILFAIRNIQMLERMGIMVLSAILKKEGHKTKLIQTEKQNIDKAVAELKPDIIAYSVTSGEVKHMLPINQKLKEKYKFVSLWGGAHPTFFPEMIKKKGVDVVAVGEAEYSIKDLAEAIRKGENYDQIPGLWVKKEDGNITKNGPGKLVMNLDELPFADLEIVYENDENLKTHGEKRILLGRGCPFNCTYCFNHKMHAMYGAKWAKVRMKSVDYIIKECQNIMSKYKVEFFRFIDDTFGLCSKEWLTEFAERWPKEVGKPFLCLLRPNLVNEHLISSIKKAGCYSVYMAVETGNDWARNQVLKRNITEEQIANAWKLIKKYKIKLAYFNMLGLPIKDALKYDLETLKMNIKYKPTLAWSSIFTPYPKTELANYAIKKGFFNGDFDSLPANNKLTSPLKFSTKEKKQIENLHKLFGITAQFPILLPLTKILIKLPQNRLYTWIMWGYFGFVMKFIMVKIHISPKELWKLIKQLRVHTKD